MNSACMNCIKIPVFLQMANNFGNSGAMVIFTSYYTDLAELYHNRAQVSGVGKGVGG